ncbi:DUF1810 domain-containing protein [Frigidibacter sp.]|uniref:DUF1810 domain-containing protein n=1 Tax=Frigidibacter sp. TaxID=2586418 RepID=UPI0027340915|nr:DUF1810 domain-containing protein [Frigidibacter sp.]MDP3339735.1 DUF1810 domain-containing protein [Frigidibacter sp.]
MSLHRFHTAQEDTYATALAELQAGQKRSHWMWFVFPQLASLGRSGTAKFYGIADLAEAQAYLADPVLGPRLIACAEAMLLHPNRTAETILGPVDAMKLRSSATLFARAGDSAAPFGQILQAFYAGSPCPLTAAALA